MKKAAILEFNTCHDELFPSAVKHLNNHGYHVDIYTKKENINKNSLFFCNHLKFDFFEIKDWKFDKIYDALLFNSFELYDGEKTYVISEEIKQVSAKTKPRVIIHNTKNLIDYMSHHHLKELNFVPVVIAKHLQHSLQENGINSEIIYPFYLGDFARDADDKNITTFAVQGNFSQKRRNYKSLMKAVYNLSQDPNYCDKFIIKLIGQHNTYDADIFKDVSQNLQISQYFHYVPNTFLYEKYFNEINQSHFIIPLIDETNSDLDHYFHRVSSSSVNIAVSLNKPLIMNEEFAKKYPHFSTSSFLYQHDNLETALRSAISCHLDAKNHAQKNIIMAKNDLFATSNMMQSNF